MSAGEGDRGEAPGGARDRNAGSGASDRAVRRSNDDQRLDARPRPFVDLQAQRRWIAGRLDQALARVHEHGAFILGPEVAELERQFTRFVGVVGHCVSCANGTDALPLALMARGVDSKSLDAAIVQARQRSLRPAVVIDVGT